MLYAMTIRSFRCSDTEALYEGRSGDRAGQHSVRINDQWRLCFVWTDVGPENVEIVDYR